MNVIETSLPPSLKKAGIKSAPSQPKEKPATIQINVDPLVEIVNRSTIKPEEIQIGAFGMSEKTRAMILAHLEIQVSDYEGYLYGVRVFLNEKIALGKVQVCDPKAKILQTLTVADV